MGRKPLISQEELEEIKSNSPYNMCDKWNLIEKYNVSEKTAERAMKKLNLIQTSSKNIECILRYLNGERNGDLVKEYGISQANFNALLRYRKIPPRYTHYFFDYRYFESIDSEDKAYFLGFVYADGNIFRNSLKISVRDYDIDVLEKILKYTKSNHEIKYSQSNKMVTLIHTHAEMPSILSKHGIIPNKTHKLQSIPKTIPLDLMNHFMRGYIDGDGSFGRYLHNDGYHRYSLSLVGTESFLTDFSKKVNELTGISFLDNLRTRHPERNNNIRALKMSGKDNILSFLDWIYKDATVYMDRKYKNYSQLVR